MKSCLFIFIFASLWGSYRNRYPSERMLNQAAQLIYSSPQQALKLLDSISQKILKRNARHNLYLLKVHAAYEAYQDISVYPPLSNTARYFQQQGDSTKAGWAYLFTGIMDRKPLSTCRKQKRMHHDKTVCSYFKFIITSESYINFAVTNKRVSNLTKKP